MTTSSPTETPTATELSTCPSWCVVPVATHETDLAEPSDPSTFHRGADADRWSRDYHWSRNELAVRVESYEMKDNAEIEELVIIDGAIDRGSQHFYELTVADAERLGRALLHAVSTARGAAGATS